MWQGKRGPKVWRMGNWEKKPGADVPTQHIDFVWLDGGDHTGHIIDPDHGGKIAVHGDDCREVAARIVEALNGAPMICDGCGTTKSMEEIKAAHPAALSCCPERKMRPITAADLVRAEVKGLRRAAEMCRAKVREREEDIKATTLVSYRQYLRGQSAEAERCMNDILAMIPTPPAGGADDAG